MLDNSETAIQSIKFEGFVRNGQGIWCTVVGIVLERGTEIVHIKDYSRIAGYPNKEIYRDRGGYRERVILRRSVHRTPYQERWEIWPMTTWDVVPI